MSTSSAAQLERDPQEEFAAPGSRRASGQSPLKLQAAERLAAHRALRQRATAPELFDIRRESSEVPVSESRAARIAAAVAERYAQSQSYRSFLAAEAERATQQARAAAEIARRNAEAIAAVQEQLLSDLAQWEPAAFEEEPAPLPGPYLPETASPLPPAALTVKLYEDAVRPERVRGTVTGMSNAVPLEALDEDECQALDEEIAFRKAPVFPEPLEAATPLSANLIEFPRQLVAARKVRPRFAEGPLRVDGSPGDNNQLRIFEVEPDLISALVTTEPVLPEWSSIRLSACIVSEPEAVPGYAVDYPTVVAAAPFGLRLMAALVDSSLVLAGFLGFVTVTAYTAGQVPQGQVAALGAAVILAALFLLYQLLFFTFGDATPGMRYARIGLCTLGDENPTRSAMRRRIGATVLATCPLGLGFVWAWLDEDGLGWHDRISRMYQRSY